MYKTFVIIRGASGSSKTTTANFLAAGYRASGLKVAGSFEADQWMMQGGEYRFDPSRLGECHDKCFECCKSAMVNGEDIVIQSNTNTTRAEYSRYLDLAAKMGYLVVEMTLKADFGSIHGVPDHVVRRQRERFES